uniref:60S ribosomal protein L37 n=1 Tax=Ascaris lumbricoides TaxID=6252 RepID=A0A0M3HNI7_ASCLU
MISTEINTVTHVHSTIIHCTTNLHLRRPTSSNDNAGGSYLRPNCTKTSKRRPWRGRRHTSSVMRQHVKYAK